MDIGNTIKFFRKEKRLSQIDLAQKCGITSTYLSLIENGKKEPTIALVRVIAEKLEIPLPVFLFSAITDNDIPEDKKDFFNMVKPSVEKILLNLIQDDVIPEDR